MSAAKMLDGAEVEAFGSRPNRSTSVIRELAALYAYGYNGGYYWGGALLIRPVVTTHPAISSVSDWNLEGLWRCEYDSACSGLVFFAEDAFGTQFAVDSKGAVFQFDPETASRTEVAPSIDRWAEVILGDWEIMTGYPVLEAWQREHGPLAPGHRLIPRTPFMLGGDFHSTNMIAKPDAVGMRIRAELWRLTKDIPDGQSIVFRVEE